MVHKELERYLREDLGAILQVLQGSDVRELDLRDGDVHLRIRRALAGREDATESAYQPAGAESEQWNGEAEETPPEGEQNGIVQITAPMVGTYHHSKQPGDPPLVSVGMQVKPGTHIGVIEALQVLTDVEADCEGVVTRILVADGEPVEYDQPLVEVQLLHG
jgi:acetyl-CoA carboxylase biotin carboxyl carrier protein